MLKFKLCIQLGLILCLQSCLVYMVAVMPRNPIVYRNYVNLWRLKNCLDFWGQTLWTWTQHFYHPRRTLQNYSMQLLTWSRYFQWLWYFVRGLKHFVYHFMSKTVSIFDFFDLWTFGAILRWKNIVSSLLRRRVLLRRIHFDFILNYKPSANIRNRYKLNKIYKDHHSRILSELRYFDISDSTFYEDPSWQYFSLLNLSS